MNNTKYCQNILAEIKIKALSQGIEVFDIARVDAKLDEKRSVEAGLRLVYEGRGFDVFPMVAAYQTDLWYNGEFEATVMSDATSTANDICGQIKTRAASKTPNI